jgi:hypothetical protein
MAIQERQPSTVRYLAQFGLSFLKDSYVINLLNKILKSLLINMPTLRFVCSDRPMKQGEIKDKAGRCFKKGLRAGYVAGIQTGKKQEKKKQPRVEAAASAVVMSKFRSIPVERASNDLRKAYLSELKVPNYRGMSAEQTIQQLRQKGITKVMLPRV